MGVLDEVISLPCHPKNRGGKRRADQIRYLVYHYTGNDGDRAVNNAKYYRDTVVQSSAHYFVDDDRICQSVEDLGIAWAVGGKKWSDCSQTGGGSLYGVVTNANSISIEMCDTQKDGRFMATQATLERAAELGRALMEKYSIPMERVVRHFDVTGKHCPAYMMDKSAWTAFRKRLAGASPRPTGEEEEVTQEKFDMMLEDYLARKQKEPLPTWAKAEFEEAVRLGITDGTEPMGLIPRYQAALMAKRAGKAS